MKVLKLVFSTTALMLCGSALADSWTVTQGVTVGSDLSVLQNNTSSNSVQSVNSVNLNGVDGAVNTGSSQNVSIQNHDLKLEQSNGTASSFQSANRVYAHTIDGVQQSVTTTGLAGAGDKISLEQTTTIGDGNQQSVNSAVTSSSGQVDVLAQTVATTNHSIAYQQRGGVSNVQAGNLIKSGNLSTTADDVTQAHTVEYASFVQSGADNSIQAGSALLMISGQSGGAIKQEFTSKITAPSLYLQSETSGSVQSMNYAGNEL